MIKSMMNTAGRTARAASVSVFVAIGALAALHAGGAQAADLLNNTNTGGVANNPNCGPALTVAPAFEARVNQLVTYHWNNGRGARPGSLSLRAANGQVFGPFYATGSSGSGGARNVNWTANVNLTLPAGTYTLNDSDRATWSQNAQSRNCGFGIIRGTLVAKKPLLVTTLLRPGTSLPGIGGSAPGVKPCYVNTGGAASIGPCAGPVNTRIGVTLQRRVNWQPDKLVFKKVIQNGVPAQVIAQLRGGGMNWSLNAPIQLCARSAGGSSAGQWDVVLIDNRGANQGNIGGFTITGCP